MDRGMLTRLATVAGECGARLDEYDYTAALRETEAFFWWFCDDHIEHVKRRRAGDSADADSATASCLTALSVMLRLFAPFLPFVTEEIWSWWHDGSIHGASWPTERETLDSFGGAPDMSALAAVGRASEITGAIRRERSLRKIAFGVPVQSLRLPSSAKGEWNLISADVLAGNNAGSASVSFGDDFTIEFAASSTSPAS
jgi:valyl-tRNA synthetase